MFLTFLGYAQAAAHTEDVRPLSSAIQYTYQICALHGLTVGLIARRPRRMIALVKASPDADSADVREAIRAAFDSRGAVDDALRGLAAAQEVLAQARLLYSQPRGLISWQREEEGCSGPP